MTSMYIKKRFKDSFNLVRERMKRKGFFHAFGFWKLSL